MLPSRCFVVVRSDGDSGICDFLSDRLFLTLISADTWKIADSFLKNYTMDLSNLLSILYPVIGPYLSKGLEEFSGEAGKSLWELIKKPFQKTEEKAIIAKAESAASSAVDHEALRTLIAERLAGDLAYRTDLLKFVHQRNSTVIVNQYGEKSVSVITSTGTINIG